MKLERKRRSFFSLLFAVVLVVILILISIIQSSVVAASPSRMLCQNYFIQSDLLTRFTPQDHLILKKIAQEYAKIQNEPYEATRSVREELGGHFTKLISDKNLSKDEIAAVRLLFFELVQSLDSTAETSSGATYRERLEHSKLQKKHIDRLQGILKSYHTSDIDEALLSSCQRVEGRSFRDTLKDAKYLLKSGANIDFKNEHGNTPLMEAVEHGLDSHVQLLLDRGADKEIYDKRGKTALILAIKGQRTALVELLLKENAEVNSNSPVWSPLMWASKVANTDIIKMLLKAGADINFASPGNKKTALMIASAHADLFTVQFLVEAGAKVDLLDVANESALLKAMRAHSEDNALYLIEKGSPLPHYYEVPPSPQKPQIGWADRFKLRILQRLSKWRK